MRWDHRVKIKHSMTKKEDYTSVKESMGAIADVLRDDTWFALFPRKVLNKFKRIPKGDEIIATVDYANKLLSIVYDYADANRIWIE